ncbi:alpha/beta hydrolase family protein [Membranihabitans marinus]|uniref:alpha/beta hydrolase family protein n=1 Tax=Membranihabitans marinus TaxID=1227546 RepID=UPI001EFF7EFD|nr:prolyl oligopeptidase family serine peptidase [Membranihabitans marinus]
MASDKDVIAYDDVRKSNWTSPFEEVSIPSTLDDESQPAWFYASTSEEPQPLLVSLHTWSGDYNQKDDLAKMAVEENWNYIHPNFRGPNWTVKACCSEYALSDIEDAIDYAIANGRVDVNKIRVVGVSGGGYAALAVYMKSKHNIEKISAWVPLVDLEAWYNESTIRGNNYANNVMKCTGSEGETLNVEEALAKSPLHWETPDRDTKLSIHAGVYDGLKGSVPITHSINFYNKLVDDLGADDEGSRVTAEETLYLLEKRKPLAELGKIGDRDICLYKSFKNIDLTIFVGGHEMLPVPGFEKLK